MRGRRPKADPRFTFHGSWERAEHDADGRGSFAAVERSMSDRLLSRAGECPARPCEDYGAGVLLTISRSSTSKTNVAPGLMWGGAPLSP